MSELHTKAIQDYLLQHLIPHRPRLLSRRAEKVPRHTPLWDPTYLIYIPDKYTRLTEVSLHLP